jgi:chemotaxis protein MotA
MRITTYIGIFVAIASVIVAIILEGAHLFAFFKISAILLIVGGTFGATFASFGISQIIKLTEILREIFTSGEREDLVESFLSLLEKSRRDGLLALEDEIEEMEEELMQKGIRLLVDGTDPSIVADILYEWADEKTEEEVFSARILETAGGFSPTIGIIGTVLGLVHVLENLNAGTQALGQGIATAFIATFYGIGFANLVLLPMSNKVRAFSRQESNRRQAMIRGILSIQSGDNKRILVERMMPFLES